MGIRSMIFATVFTIFTVSPTYAQVLSSASSGGQCPPGYGYTATNGASCTPISGGSTDVPEPADFGIFAIGVGGLIISLRKARKAKKSLLERAN